MSLTLPATPIISIIVATRNRRDSLRQLIDGLRRLPDKPAWELIVADNGSTDGTATLLSTFAADLPIAVVTEKEPGKSRALNKAMKHAHGDIVLFTDDDVVPDPDWLMALHKAALEYPSANVFGGRILVNYERVPKWIVKSSNLKTILVSEQDFGNDTRFFAAGDYPIGPNLAVRRRLLDAGSRGWPVNFGPGTKIPLGDERAFLMQLSAAHARDRVYVPGSVVRHDIHGRQLSISKALSRCFLGGYASSVIARMRDGSGISAETNSLRTAWRRLCGLSSGRELICVVARALGVMAGSVTPSARVIYS